MSGKFEEKQRAVRYFHENQVPKQLETLLNEMFHKQPDDIYGYMVRLSNNSPFSPIVTLKIFPLSAVAWGELLCKICEDKRFRSCKDRVFSHFSVVLFCQVGQISINSL